MDVDEQDAIVKELQVYLFKEVYNIGIGAYYHYMYNWPWVKNYYGEIEPSYYQIGTLYAATM